jgi:predicted DNA-binding transcriptional regulator AlpA
MTPKTETITVGPIVPATLTRKELEAALKVSGRTICRLVAQRQLPAPFKVGRASRWRAEDIVRFIEARG